MSKEIHIQDPTRPMPSDVAFRDSTGIDWYKVDGEGEDYRATYPLYPFDAMIIYNIDNSGAWKGMANDMFIRANSRDDAARRISLTVRCKHEEW